MPNNIKIKKFSGALVDFDKEKLIKSLRNSKASEDLVQKIASEVQKKLYDGISTKQIYQMAYRILNKTKEKSYASRYKLKKAIMELGPSGFPFEKYIAKIINSEGFKTEVGVYVQGFCVIHEVDVVAKNDHTHYMVECKYHNTQGRINDIKIPLYIQSRFMDIEKQHKKQNGENSKFHQGWIYTNTRFSSDAIEFAECAGLKLVSWDYPQGKSLKDKINNSHLFPITVLTTLTRKEKSMLLERNIIICKEICENPGLLLETGIDRSKHKKIIENARGLC
jgi:hypothetical protein